MAVFPVPGNTGNNIGALRSALQSAGVITTLYYETTTTLIFSTPYSNKVIKFTNADGISLFVGDAWTSGATITNQVQISRPYQSSFGSTNSHAVITGPDTFVVAIAGGSTVTHCFTKFTNGHFVVMTTENDNSLAGSYYMRTYNTTLMEQLLPAFYPYKVITQDTLYYQQFNPIWRTYVGVYFRDYQFVPTVRILMRAADLGAGISYEIAGNDVVCPLRNFKDSGGSFDLITTIVIKGGNI